MNAATTLILILVYKTLAESPTVIKLYYPNTNDCSKFTRSYLNEAVTYECPRGYQWNYFMKRCDLSYTKPSNAPKYQYSLDNRFTGHEEIKPVYTTHGGNSRYEISRIAKPLRSQCRKGYAFNTYTNRCEVLQPTNSRSKSPYLAPKLATTNSPDGNSSGGCPPTVDPNNPVYLPHLDCAKFYMCTPSGPEEWRCPEGLHWSETVKRCDQWWRAGCQRSEGVISMETSTISSTVTTTTTTTISSSYLEDSTPAIPSYSLTTTASEDGLGDKAEDTTHWEDIYTTDYSIIDGQIF